MNNNTDDHTKGSKSPERYAFLLHLWQSTGQWRASLEIPKTGKRLGFSGLEQLFAYLMDLIEGNLNKQSNPDKERTERSSKRNWE